MLTISKKACDLISPSFFKRPSIPLIDGRGSTWTPYSSSTSSLYDYTLNEQVINTFNFSTAVSVALKEYCPDNILLLGPGNSLGGVIGQVLVSSKWLGINQKEDFLKTQGKHPFLISLGLTEQRDLM